MRTQIAPTVRQLPPTPPPPLGRRRPRTEASFGWTFAITAAALFMFGLDRLIVITALPAVARDLGGGLTALEWTINAATLAFTVLLLGGAALGDRFGRRRVFVAGVALLTAGSAAGALSPSAGWLIAARGVQGAGGALVVPLSLTIVSAVTPAERRGAVLGAWGAVAAIAAATGPVLGGVLTDALSWHWIFWANVPIGVALIPLAARKLTESHGPHPQLDRPGLALSGTGLLATVWGLVEASSSGWGSTRVLAALAAGALALAAFVSWELRAPAPMLPMRFFRSGAFSASAAVSVVAYFALFGALFLIGQLLQVGLGATPLDAGLGLLPMTGAMVLTAPVAGRLCDRAGPTRLLPSALAVVAAALGWLAAVAAPGVAYATLVPGLVLVGAGAGLLFAPIQATLLGSVRPVEQGQAAGAGIALRELGGLLGVSVLGGVFAAHGSGGSPEAFLAGFRPAVLVASLVVAAAALVTVAASRGRILVPAINGVSR